MGSEERPGKKGRSSLSPNNLSSNFIAPSGYTRGGKRENQKKKKKGGKPPATLSPPFTYGEKEGGGRKKKRRGGKKESGKTTPNMDAITSCHFLGGKIIQ